MHITLNFQGRQSGKTTKIINQSLNNDIIVCHNYNSVNEMRHKINSAKKIIVSVNSYLFENLRGLKFENNTIWLDEFDHMTIDEQNGIFDFFNVNNAKKIIGYSYPYVSFGIRKHLRNLYYQYYNTLHFQYLEERYIRNNISKLFLYANEINVG